MCCADMHGIGRGAPPHLSWVAPAGLAAHVRVHSRAACPLETGACACAYPPEGPRGWALAPAAPAGSCPIVRVFQICCRQLQRGINTRTSACGAQCMYNCPRFYNARSGRPPPGGGAPHHNSRVVLTMAKSSNLNAEACALRFPPSAGGAQA